MTTTGSTWRVRLPDGEFFVPPDARPDDPNRALIYSRFVADLFAAHAGGTVEPAPCDVCGYVDAGHTCCPPEGP